MSDYDNYDECLAFDPNMPRCDIERLQEDCKTLAKKLLEVKPELRGWLKVNFKEYIDGGD